MDEGHQTQEERPRTESYEDEIELMDYLLVIWKWKYLIIAGTLVCGLIAFAISITIPKPPNRYRLEMVLAPGVKSIDESGKKVYINSPTDIQALIEGELKYTISDQIKNTSNPAMPNGLQYKITILPNTNLLKISCESQIADEGMKKLNYLTKALLNYYTEIIKNIKKIYEDEIQLKKSDLIILKADQGGLKKNIDNLHKRIVEMEMKMKPISENTEMLIRQRNTLTKINNQQTTLTGLLIANAMQQNLSLENIYRSQLINHKFQKEKTEMDLLEIKKQIETLIVEIKKLEEEKNNIQNIQILKTPTATQIPIKKPKTKRNVLLASILGLSLMIFLSFFLEYLSKYKGVEKQERGPLASDEIESKPNF